MKTILWHLTKPISRPPSLTSRVNLPPFGAQIASCMSGNSRDRRRAVVMFRLDYLSCILSVVATILVGRRLWTGLVVSGVNSLIVCVIGLHTSQYGFIPANVFCICINALNLRAWLRLQKDPSEWVLDAGGERVAGSNRMEISKSRDARRSLSYFRMHSERKLGNSISSLAVKGEWPFAIYINPEDKSVVFCVRGHKSGILDLNNRSAPIQSANVISNTP